MKFAYRPDIDGLRAVAVLSVLFFHTEVSGFSGGFVGVDIFFVISGFLITTILLKDIRNGDFSIARFYERRIRRIFPALFPVIAVAFAVGAYLFEANAFKDLGKSITATTLFSSNILFWKESGYFDASSVQKPLLHTWSLAVEEQFYIFFPLALVFINRYLKSQYLFWILIVMSLSLGISIWGVYNEPSMTFYLVPTRAWELLAGAVLALGVLPNLSSVLLRNLLSIAGLGLIVFSVIFYTEETLFPGHNAIVPVLGASLVIYSGNGDDSTIIANFLKAKPMVFVGMISYSLYLWHWLIISFSKYLMFRPFNWSERLYIILASIIISTLSWRFIEQPFRGKYPLVSDSKRLFAYSAYVMFFVSMIGVLIYLQKGMPYRYPETNAVSVQAKWDWHSNLVYGNLEQESNNVKPGRCGLSGAMPSFLLWGDSHAMSLIPGIDEKSKAYGLQGYIATHSTCPPVLKINIEGDRVFNEVEFNENVFHFIHDHPEIRVVFLASGWSIYDDRYFNELAHSDTVRYDLLQRGLKNTVDELVRMGRKVVLISDIPTLKIDENIRYSYLAIRFPDYYRNTGYVARSRYEYDEENRFFIDKIIKIVDGKNVILLNSWDVLFDKKGQCQYIINNTPLYKDGSHLSTFGSQYVAAVFDEIFIRKGLFDIN
jgi:peptidoglycan/LPS O-acetylase OafA/YrhL